MNQSRYWREKNAEMSAANDALRQQLADVSSERNGLRVLADDQALNLRRVKREYRALRIAATDEREASKLRLNASEAWNAKAVELLHMILNTYGYGLREGDHASLKEFLLAQSAPATNTSGKAHCPHDGICHTSDETCAEAKVRIIPNAPATDEQEAGS